MAAGAPASDAALGKGRAMADQDAVVELAVARAMQHPDFATRFKHPVKFNGTDFVEHKVPVDEQRAQLANLARRQLHVFLERYGAMLVVDDLRGLATLPAAEAPECQIWLQRLNAAPASAGTQAKVARRRRWEWARREMATQDGFFSEEHMMERRPKLYRRLVGRHVEPTTLTSTFKGSLSTYLLERLEKQCEEGGQGGGDEPAPMSESEDEDSGPEAGQDADAGAPDIANRRAEFLHSMRDTFVNGQERGFDYDRVDADSDLDDLKIRACDEEETYFDAD